MESLYSVDDYLCQDGNFGWKFVFVATLCAMIQPQPVVFLVAGSVVFYDHLWYDLYDWVGSGQEWNQSSLLFFATVILPVVFVVVYWANGLFMLGLDLAFPEFMDQFRVQADKKRRSGNKHFRDDDKLQMKDENLRKLIRNVAINSALLPPMIASYAYFMQFYSPFPLQVSREIPNARDMAWQMLLNASILNEIFFFYGHWLFHANKWLYKNIHKVHHEFTSPNAFAALYCHPVELLISDIVPMSLGLFLVNAHVYTVMCWIALGIIGTQTHHSGLRFPWALKDHQPKFHDLHHQYFNGNYGNIGLLDWVHGTTFSDEFLIRAGELPPPDKMQTDGAKGERAISDRSTDCETFPPSTPTIS